SVSLSFAFMRYWSGFMGGLAWSRLAFGIYKAGRRGKASNAAALLVSFAVFSHWILDLVVHRPDLAIYDDTLKVGFGLWNYKGLEFGLEIAILIGGIIIYLRRNALSVARKS